MIRENPRKTLNGFSALAMLLALLVGLTWGLIHAASKDMGWLAGVCVLLGVAGTICLVGFFMVNPNEARVLQFFGDYAGTVKTTGLRWANPFFTKKRISLRIRNFETEKLKVNDQDGNPIEIAAVVVWKVVDTAEALFEVDEFVHYVRVQSEAALRNLATSYAYDAYGEEVSLRSHTEIIAKKLQKETQDRLDKAGVKVIEARISHLAYAPEIAGAMLRRQQAAAVVAARAKIVEGAVGMVEMALAELDRKKVLELDDERKANMVSNLLVILCGENEARPVVNAGSLY